MMGLCYQSLHSNQLMTRKLFEMTTESEQAASLSTAAHEQEVSSHTLADEALLDETEASALSEQADLLQEASLKDEALANGDLDAAHELQMKMSSEQTELEAHSAAAAEEEAIVDEETTKANTELAEAALDTEELISDGYATAACEWIPFVDVVCDVVGGIAAIGLESAASKLSIESGLDYALAAASKIKEEKDLAAVATLEAALEEDGALELELETKAEEEQVKAEEEEAEAVQDRAAAKEKTEQSEEEMAASEEAAAEAEAEEVEASERLAQSVQDGMSAFWHAFVSGVSSTVALFFFVVRFITAVLIPGGEVLVGFVSLNILSNAVNTTSGGGGLGVVSEAVASSPATRVERGLLTRTWDALPKRQVSYFTLHCGVFMTTMAFYCRKFQLLGTFDLRSKGGIILIFASSAALIQLLLLHVLGRVFETKSSNSSTSTGTSTSTVQVSESRCGAFVETFFHFTSLTSLFVMETLGLWLVFGQCAFLVQTLWGPFFLSLVLFSTCALYHYIFSKKQKDLVNEEAMAIAAATQESLCEESPLLSRNTSDNEISFQQRTLSEDLSIDSGAFTSTSLHDLEHHGDIKNDDSTSSLHDLEHRDKSENDDPAYLDEEKSWYAYFACGNYTFPSVKDEISCSSSTVNESMATPTLLFNRYISTLQLPFEVLVMTCMIVLLQKCAPVVIKLWSNVIESHGLWIIGWSGLFVVLIGWCSFSNRRGDRINVDLWSGTRPT
jgi:hypothetical protein